MGRVGQGLKQNKHNCHRLCADFDGRKFLSLGVRARHGFDAFLETSEPWTINV
jgi:hypothetical protein